MYCSRKCMLAGVCVRTCVYACVFMCILIQIQRNQKRNGFNLFYSRMSVKCTVHLIKYNHLLDSTRQYQSVQWRVASRRTALKRGAGSSYWVTSWGHTPLNMFATCALLLSQACNTRHEHYQPPRGGALNKVTNSVTKRRIEMEQNLQKSYLTFSDSQLSVTKCQNSDSSNFLNFVPFLYIAT